MKINSIYISSFGGLKNVKLDLKDGFNVIYGDNENGKSTIMAFIKMMFYGSERGSYQISKNIRKKYTPWDNSTMAGSIDFEHSGKEYRIEREFRSSNSTDKVTLYDLGLGTHQSVNADVGTQFFSLSAAAFERSVFIGQLGFPESDSVAEGEINSKLSNIALTGDETVSFETVNSRLQKAKTALMSKSGKAGQYDKNLKACTELKARIEKAHEQQNDYNLAVSKITAMQNELQSMLKNAQELKIKLDAEQDIRNAEKLKTLLELKVQLDELNSALTLDNGEILDEMFLRKLQFCISRIDAVKQKQKEKLAEKDMLERSISAGLNPSEDATEENAERLQNEIKALSNRHNEIEKATPILYQKLIEYESGAKKTVSNIKAVSSLCVGIVFIAIATIFAILNLIFPLAIAAILGVILICLCPVLLSKSKRETLKSQAKIGDIKSEIDKHELETSKISEEIFAKKVKLESIIASLNSSSTIIANQQELLKEVDATLKEIDQELNTETQSLLQLYSRYKNAETFDEVIDGIQFISKNAAEVKELKQQINFILKDLNGISYEDAARKLEKLSSETNFTVADFEELKQKYDFLIQEISERKADIASLTAQANTYKNSTESIQKLTEELKQLLRITKSQKEFCDCADIATETLLESFAQIRKSYGAVLEKKATEIFSGLTGEKYQGMNISKSLEITVTEKDIFGSRDIAYLSSGTADQAYLSLRLALSSLISGENESLPILLDDALTQYDDNRIKTALEFLSEYAKSTQVIMFTCHKSIVEFSENLNAQNISLVKNI